MRKRQEERREKSTDRKVTRSSDYLGRSHKKKNLSSEYQKLLNYIYYVFFFLSVSSCLLDDKLLRNKQSL